MKVNLVNENFKENYLQNLLQSRGVQDVQKYISPDESCLNNWRDLDNIYKGIELLHQIIEQNGKILIVVDCDVDGFTSAAIIWNYLKCQYSYVQIDLNYKLHEHKQHGLEDLIDDILSSNTHYDLIILPDSSTNDYNFHEQLKEIHTKCLVLDHHDLEDKMPISDNACIINNQLSPKYQNKGLTGAGVAWQFCRGFDEYEETDYAENLIDLAALGICGDMGPILELENRYIMLTGFKNIQNFFFECAIQKQSFSIGDEITPIGVAFYIVPMMNALIRVGTMEEKERLFLGLIDGRRLVPCNKRNAKGTEELVAIESLRECTNAKSKQDRIAEQMVQQLEQKIFKYDLLENKILFVRMEDDIDYPQEITGLAAMKLAAKYKRPTILARLNEQGYDRGSIRNVNDCELQDLKQFLNDSGYFEWVQGHANAAGASILDSNLSAFHKYANEALKDIDFNEGLYNVNFECEPYSENLRQMIFSLASDNTIYGQGNPEPLIFIPNIHLKTTEYKVIGKNKDTVRFEVNGIIYIKFHAKDLIAELENCSDDIKISVVGKPNINEWMGNFTPQLMIEDYEVIDDLFAF